MIFNEKIAHIVYASDNKFAEILGVSLTSLYENSKDMEDLVVYILDNAISDKNKNKLVSIARFYNRTLPVFIQAKDITHELQMDVVVDRGSLSQYARLFISSSLPKELKRVLYLDCDTIINKSIDELWNLDIEGKTIAALMDAFSKYYRTNIDLKPMDIMFNSGVMLVDLKRWEDQKIEERLLQFITTRKGRIQQGDQGALNAILSHDTYCFEPRFNSLTIFYDFSYEDMLIYRKPPKFYSEEQIEMAINDPSIIHFTTSFLSKRPWVEGCKHRYIKEWMKYKKISPWKDRELWNDNSSKWKQKVLVIYKRFPGKMTLYLAGFMQAYGRPIKNRMTKK